MRVSLYLCLLKSHLYPWNSEGLSGVGDLKSPDVYQSPPLSDHLTDRSLEVSRVPTPTETIDFRTDDRRRSNLKSLSGTRSPILTTDVTRTSLTYRGYDSVSSVQYHSEYPGKDENFPLLRKTVE